MLVVEHSVRVTPPRLWTRRWFTSTKAFNWHRRIKQFTKVGYTFWRFLADSRR